MDVLVFLIKLIALLGVAMLLIGLVGGALTAGGTNVSHGIRPSRNEPGSYIITRVETRDEPWDYNHIFWIMFGIGLLVTLVTIGLVFLTGMDSYMSSGATLSAFCNEITASDPDYQTAYGRFTDNIQHLYSEAAFVKYLHKNGVVGCTANGNIVSFEVYGLELSGQNIACGYYTPLGWMGEARINTFPFNLKGNSP